ncbi:pathogenicity island protein [Staphylococcus caeli]|uniref:Pathogenicity island protein n=1 Tax=Staphylococcus caeli TaxID=2201815 RepID=A0A1D4Q8Y0_9STAP|nr:pathogenicity island protein [Staphylococcus caeli]SCT24848.1 pathogenicity island protein [Staphylococcus caeli]SCT31654.1 pathogenicity island protein [Staphylococcus caeli]
MTKVAEKKKQTLPDDHLQVLNVIRNASDKYITKIKILNQLGYEYNSTNERWIRLVISNLIERHEYPIGCSYKKGQRGYYMISNKDEQQQAMHSIKRLIDGNVRRYEAIKKLEV